MSPEIIKEGLLEQRKIAIRGGKEKSSEKRKFCWETQFEFLADNKSRQREARNLDNTIKYWGDISKSCVMLLTIIVLYSFIVRCLKRENKLVAASSSVTSNSVTTSNSTSSSTTTSIAYNHFSKGLLKDEALGNRDKDDRALVDKREKDNPNDSSKEPYSDDEVADDNQFDEEEFYNIIATKAAAFQSKRNSSTSTVSSGSIYDETYRTKRNSLRSQSSTCSEVMESSTAMSNRRSSEDRAQRKLNYKTRRHGFTTLSKRRRTTGRYFLTNHSHEKRNFLTIMIL